MGAEGLLVLHRREDVLTGCVPEASPALINLVCFVSSSYSTAGTVLDPAVGVCLRNTACVCKTLAVQWKKEKQSKEVSVVAVWRMPEQLHFSSHQPLSSYIVIRVKRGACVNAASFFVLTFLKKILNFI